MTRTECSAPPIAAWQGTPRRPRRLALQFEGSASVYFRIWIVNVSLTLLTLGLYAPWAKVRKKQYLYSQVRLDGTPFRYLAPPFALFKARLITAVLVGGFYAATHVYVGLQWCALLIAGLALPWILVRATAFEAHYSAFGNLRFGFRGTYTGALRCLLLALLQAVTVVGLPWAYCRVRTYFSRGICYGGVRARAHYAGNRLLGPCLLALALGAMSVAFAAVLITMFSHREQALAWVLPGGLVVLYVGYALAYSLLQTRVMNLLWRGARLGPLWFEPSYRARHLFLIYLTNTLACVASLGLLVPWASVRLARYRTERLSVIANRGWDAFSATAASNATLSDALADSLALTLEVGA
jgi:uncharacterized membrane protein YjgN (DUF898 family)